MNAQSQLIPNDEVTLLHAKLCRAVGDPKRIQLLYVLADIPRSVNQLSELLNTPQPTISRHLAVLRESGLVRTERDGTSIIYSLAVPEIIDVINQMRSILHTVIAEQATSLEDD